MKTSRVKTGRPRIEDRARTIEVRKPWLKLEMSGGLGIAAKPKSVRAGGDDRGADRSADGRAPQHQSRNPALNRPPVVRDFLIVQMPDTRYVGRVPLTLRPGDGLCLTLECFEHAIPLFLDDIVHNSGPFRRPLGRPSMKTVVMFLSPIVVDRGEHCTKPKAPTAANGLPAGLDARAWLSAPPGAPSAWGRATFHCTPPRRSSSAARPRNDVQHDCRHHKSRECRAIPRRRKPRQFRLTSWWRTQS
jgi:hypothetical protein